MSSFREDRPKRSKILQIFHARYGQRRSEGKEFLHIIHCGGAFDDRQLNTTKFAEHAGAVFERIRLDVELLQRVALRNRKPAAQELCNS